LIFSNFSLLLTGLMAGLLVVCFIVLTSFENGVSNLTPLILLFLGYNLSKMEHSRYDFAFANSYGN